MSNNNTSFKGSKGAIESQLAKKNKFIKFFDGDGNKLGDDIELEIEAQLEREMVCVEVDQLGRAATIASPVVVRSRQIIWPEDSPPTSQPLFLSISST